ncbi:MAG: hypothetical protein K2P49_01895 [Oscillospiraceae bacterium]|nr:hypothetical protein [Oscillospiraceae bacterium]
MTVSEIVKGYLKTEKMTKAELCRRMGWSSQNLSGRLNRNSFSAEDWRKVMEAMGYELRIVKPGSSSGLRLPAGPRVRKMEGKIIYDTATSEPLCNTRVDEDDLMFQELYRDQMGRYFIVSYAMWEGGVHQVTPIGRADARTFYERFSAAGDADDIFREGSGDNE